MLFQPAICSLTMLAPAKLNLFLRVLSRRTDGFHEIETVMTSVNIFDTLRFESSDSAEVAIRVMMAASRSSNTARPEPIPAGPENLVVRAARLLKEYARTDQNRYSRSL